MALAQADRSATFSFCQNGPFLAAGSVAGAIDLSFSTSSQLEIFSLDFASGQRDLKLAGSAVQAPERFARLAWGSPGPDRSAFPYGLLAGGLSDGSVCLWNPARIIGQPAGGDSRGQLLCRLQKHQGGVRGLEFNPFSPNLLASGAADGELCIWDVGNPAQPSLYPAMKGANAGSGSDITCLSWNRKVQHILGTASANGTVVVWDLKKQRPVISFKDPGGRRRCSAVAWNPEVATQLVVASDDDASPALQLWDLRNSVSPLMELHGHAKGVLALSWCPQDASFLLSSGKDNRVIVWDVPSGQQHSELPAEVNWKFDVQWAPGKNAGVFGGATFEGKISLHSLGSCQPPAMDPTTGYQPPYSTKPPTWMKRPAGAAFGFGGKLVKFTNSKRQLPTGEIGETGTIEIKQITVDTSTPDISPEFEQVIRSSDREALRTLCENRAASSTDPKDAETWQFLQTHFEPDGRQHLLVKLGFGDALPKPEEPEQTVTEEAEQPAAVAASDTLAALSLQQQQQAAAAHATAANLMGGADDGSAFFAQSPVDSGNFFDNLQTPVLSPAKGAPPASPSAAAAERSIVDGQPGEGEEEINNALLVGNYQGAVDACLKHSRYADALIASSLVGGETWEKARKEFLYAQPRPYMRVVHAVLSGDWEAFVASRPASAWRQTLAALLTSAPYDQFETLVAGLATKLAHANIIHAATLCYVCSGDVESAVRLWNIEAGTDAPPSVKESVMEKAVVLGMGVDRAGASSALGDLLARHAEALASNGRLSAAYDLLTLVPGDGSSRAAILRDRLFRSGAVPQAAAAAPAFPFTQETVATSAGYGAPAAVSAMKPAMPTQQPAAPTPAPSAQTYRPGYGTSTVPNGYGGYSGAPTAGPPPTAPSVFQPTQPTAPTPGYGAPPPPTAPPPTTFQPAAPPPTQLKPSPPPPTVYQHQQPGPPAGGMQMQQPPMPTPSPRAPPPTVFQPTAGPSGLATAGSMGPPPPTQPPMGMAPPPPTTFQPAQAPPVATPAPPQVYQHVTSPRQQVPPPQQHPSAPPPTVYQPASTPAGMQQASMYGPMPGSMQSPHHAAPAAAPAPPPPRGPPADISIATADTSAVPAELRGVVASLTGLFQACEAMVGAHPSRRRELDDASKKLGALLWKMNEGEVSPSVGGKLQQLCQALDMGDYHTAGHVQVQLTTADWDECAAWLTALKRLIKVRQSG